MSKKETQSQPVRQVNFTLQGKGGVGKSFVSSLIAQFLMEKQQPLICYDTDPINATFAGYEPFKARRLELMQDNKINDRNFDNMMEAILTEDANFIVDNGASSFIPLSNYLIENDAINMINDASKQVVIHTVITGNQALKDTLVGFNQLAEQMPEKALIIVWLNEFFGDIEAENKTFTEMKVYNKHKERVHGIIKIPRQTSETFGKDLEIMLDNRQTFKEALTDPAFTIMSKQRLKMMQKAIFDQLELIIG